jgi:hypothetical protein
MIYVLCVEVLIRSVDVVGEPTCVWHLNDKTTTADEPVAELFDRRPKLEHMLEHVTENDDVYLPRRVE